MSPRAFILGLLLAGGGIAFAACGFPDVEFAPEGLNEAGGSTLDGSDDGAASADGGSKDAHDELPPDVDPEGTKQDASTKGDADTTVDASGCMTCDCDHDGFLRVDAGCTGGPGAVFDCDDTDTFLPQQSFVTDFTWPSKVHSIAYDWNCDRKVDKQYRYDVKCGVLADCTAQGFATNPGCGIEADYIYCKDSFILGIACTEDTAKREKRTQGCR
jgi:hypothetical protein